MHEPVVWQLAGDDGPAAGDLIARAFHDAPLYVDAVPDAAERATFLPLFFTEAVHRAIAWGGAWAIGDQADRLAGAALWRPIPEPDAPAERRGLDGADPIASQWSAALERVTMEVETAIAAMPDLPARWRYLETIAVDPPRQKQGLGAALLRRLLADTAAEGVPLVLFTGRPKNAPLYERVGFDLVWRGIPPGGRLPLWAFRASS